jgi:peptidoglycan/LPS O-acetylase OafA/YrhL
MPWSFKAVIAAFVVFVVGALVIAFACNETGWQSIGHFAWGLLTAVVGLVGGILFSIICATTEPTWRRSSLVLGVVSILLLIGLLLFAKAA